jgi:hypothetical protein
MTDGATSDDHRRGVMPADGGRGLLLQWREPVLTGPLGRVGRVNRQHPHSPVGAHLHQTSAEPVVRNARDRPPPPSATGATPERFASNGASVGEIEILDGDRSAALAEGKVDELADGRSQPPIASRSTLTFEHERDRAGTADWVPR